MYEKLTGKSAEAVVVEYAGRVAGGGPIYNTTPPEPCGHNVEALEFCGLIHPPSHSSRTRHRNAPE